MRGRSKIANVFFGDRDIDVDDYTIVLPKSVHDGLHRGKGTGPGGPWNKAWKDFIAKNPTATKQEVLDFASSMLDNFKIRNYYTDYRRYSLAKKAATILKKKP